eukprot:11138218-Alexandrium_andersonii.AAC.1
MPRSPAAPDPGLPALGPGPLRPPEHGAAACRRRSPPWRCCPRLALALEGLLGLARPRKTLAEAVGPDNRPP